jgi:integral membrane protein
VKAALTRFRVMAYVVGVMLLLLVFVAMPLKYIADQPRLVEVIGPIHGFLYAVYLLVTLDLSSRLRWRIVRTLLVMLAGTIPFLSFVAERRVVRDVRLQQTTAT